MPDIGAVIFDVYETLAQNHSSLWLPTFDEFCQEQGLPLTGQELWDLWKPLEMRFRHERMDLDDPDNSPPYKTYEHAWRDSFVQVFSQIGKGDAAAAARRMVVDLGRRQLYQETVDVIARLRSANHFRLGVLSNSDNSSLGPLLDLHGLKFDEVISSERARLYKPHPGAFQLMTRALEVPAEACLFVGDSQFDDVQGAHRVGMRTVWVNRNGAHMDPALPAPDHHVQDLTGVLDVLGVPSVR